MPGGGVPLGQHDLRLGEGLVDLLPVEDAGHVAEGGHVAGPATCHVSRVTRGGTRHLPEVFSDLVLGG